MSPSFEKLKRSIYNLFLLLLKTPVVGYVLDLNSFLFIRKISIEEWDGMHR